MITDFHSVRKGPDLLDEENKRGEDRKKRWQNWKFERQTKKQKGKENAS